MNYISYRTNPIITFNDHDGTIKTMAWGTEERMDLTSIELRNSAICDRAPQKSLKSKTFLSGIALTVNSIKINDHCILRRLTREDFIEDYNPRLHINISIARQMTIWPTAILEMETIISEDESLSENDRFDSIGKAQLNVEIGVAILRLFRTAPIANLRTLIGRGITLANSRHPLTDLCVIAENDVEKLNQFWNALQKLISVDFVRSEKTYLGYAFGRYSEAYLYGGRDEDRVASAVMVLEILYGSPQAVVVSQRAAKVLGHAQDDPIGVRDLIKSAYKIRNEFVHGSLLTQETTEKARIIRPKIYDVVRKSIVAQLYVPTNEKAQFIEKVDNALLDQDTHTELENLLNLNPVWKILKTGLNK